MNTILLVLGFLSLSIPSQGVPLGKDSPGKNVPPVVPSWIGQQDGMKHFEFLQGAEEGVRACAERRSNCEPNIRKHLDSMITDKDVVFFIDICIFYACRHAPYASTLSVCSNVPREMKVVAATYKRRRSSNSEIDYSDIAACANDKTACTKSTHKLMDSMVKRKDFTLHLNNLMEYLCEHAPYDIELAACTGTAANGLDSIASRPMLFKAAKPRATKPKAAKMASPRAGKMEVGAANGIHASVLDFDIHHETL
jgi:hypothetical protein